MRSKCPKCKEDFMSEDTLVAHYVEVHTERTDLVQEDLSSESRPSNPPQVASKVDVESCNCKTTSYDGVACPIHSEERIRTILTRVRRGGYNDKGGLIGNEPTQDVESATQQLLEIIAQHSTRARLNEIETLDKAVVPDLWEQPTPTKEDWNKLCDYIVKRHATLTSKGDE